MGKNTIDTRTNNKNVTLLQVNFRGGEFPAYIHKGVIYENRDDEPIHWAIKDWEEIWCEYCGERFERIVKNACGKCRDEFKIK